jgi:hypothetical protein
MDGGKAETMAEIPASNAFELTDSVTANIVRRRGMEKSFKKDLQSQLCTFDKMGARCRDHRHGVVGALTIDQRQCVYLPQFRHTRRDGAPALPGATK